VGQALRRTLFRISASLQELSFLDVDILQKVRNGYKVVVFYEVMSTLPLLELSV